MTVVLFLEAANLKFIERSAGRVWTVSVGVIVIADQKLGRKRELNWNHFSRPEEFRSGVFNISDRKGKKCWEGKWLIEEVVEQMPLQCSSIGQSWFTRKPTSCCPVGAIINHIQGEANNSGITFSRSVFPSFFFPHRVSFWGWRGMRSYNSCSMTLDLDTHLFFFFFLILGFLNSL